MAKMGVLEEPSDLHLKHQQLAKELNLDEETAQQAWNSYQTISTNYSLEGDDLHWLGCAVFVACRKTVTPTLSRNVVKGSPVSLTSLLRFCNISVMLFFNKIGTWMSMAKMQDDEEFKSKVQKLQANFVITCNVYKEFFPTFEKIFKAPDMEAVRHRNRRQRVLPCTPTKVFEFTWLLFITVKGKHVSCENDLITTYYFLLACFDLIFKNALLGNHRDLLNPNFEGLPTNWQLTGYQTPTQAPCIIDKLLTQHTNMLADAVFEKEYRVKRYIVELIEDNVLRGNPDTLTGLLDPGNFEHNYVAVTKAYDQYILNEGSIDERIFLVECQRQYMLQNAVSNGNSAVQQPSIDDVTDEELPRINSAGREMIDQCPPTPLTGRRYVGPREQNETMLAVATESITRLHNVLIGCTTEPSEALSALFKNCSEDPTDKIKGILEKMSNRFLENYNEPNTTPDGAAAAGNSEQQVDGERKVQLSTTLFYKLLENVLLNETKIKKDISTLLTKDIFYECMFCCCLEIILFSYSSQKKFPWILDALDVQAMNLVRVIELIVRSKDQLSRDTIKHLSYVEESILESLMWKSNSILWEELKKWGEIPKFEEIALPSNLMPITMGNSATKRALFTTGSPFTNITKLEGTGQSPGPSAVDTFQSPIQVQVKKQLFHTVKPGQSLLQNNRNVTHYVVTDQDGNKQLIPVEHRTIVTSIPSPVSVPVPPSPETKPKKTGSHCIICRKFYNLAGVRLEDLCNQLGIAEQGLKQKIWTVFELSVRKTTDLLRDRHLDQLLMCAVYVICKVTRNSKKNFTEIMKCYRVQPQANSDIYRDVLIHRAKKDGSSVTPETRSDLIEFYNNIYVQDMKTFVMPFTDSHNQNNDVSLSHLPSVKSLLVSPRHQITKNVFVRPFESPNNTNNNSTNSFSYFFSRSASKDLKDINKAINQSSVTGKRLLSDESDCDQPNKRLTGKVQALIEQRKVQKLE